MESFDADEEKQYIPIVQSMDEAFSLLSFRQYEHLGLEIDVTDIISSLDKHQEWFESLDPLDKALTLDSVGALPIETQWVLEAEMKSKGRVKTITGKPHKPRKLVKDKEISPEEASKKLQFEASGQDYLWVDWRDGKIQISANRPTPTSMHVCWVWTPDSPTPFMSTMKDLANWLILTGKTLPMNLVVSDTELDFFITKTTVAQAKATEKELEDSEWPYLLVDDTLPGMIRITYDDNLTDYAEDPNNWVVIQTGKTTPLRPPEPKKKKGKMGPPPPSPTPTPTPPTPYPGPLSYVMDLFDAEFREDEVMWQDDFHKMLPTGSEDSYFAFREEEPSVVYTVRKMTIDGEALVKILHIWEPYEENSTPYDSYIQKLIVDHDLLNAEPDDDLEPEVWYDPTEPWMEEFAAPEGVCLFCDETEDLEIVNLDGWPEELCETCRDPEQYLAENWGGDPEGPLAKALEAARAKKPKELRLVRLPCFYCGAEALTDKGVLYYRAQLPSGKWDSVEVCQPCLQKQHNFGAEFDDPRVAGFNNSPYSDQEIQDMPQKFGISCTKCGCTIFKKAMASYNKNTGTMIYYPCANTVCDEVVLVQAAESFSADTHKSRRVSEVTVEVEVPDKSNYQRVTFLLPTHIVNNDDIKHSAVENRLMDILQQPFGGWTTLSIKELEAETFEAPKTMTPTQAKKKFVALLKPYWIREIKAEIKLIDPPRDSMEKEDKEIFEEWLKIAKSGKIEQDPEMGDTAVRERAPMSFYLLQTNHTDDYQVWEDIVNYWQDFPKSIKKQLKALLPAIKGVVAKPKPKKTKKTKPKAKKAPAKKAKPKAKPKAKAKKAPAKKKTGRKAPTISATKRKVGTRMRGNDGKMWEVKKSGKSQRWMAGAESVTTRTPPPCKRCSSTNHTTAKCPDRYANPDLFLGDPAYILSDQDLQTVPAIGPSDSWGVIHPTNHIIRGHKIKVLPMGGDGLWKVIGGKDVMPKHKKIGNDSGLLALIPKELWDQSKLSWLKNAPHAAKLGVFFPSNGRNWGCYYDPWEGVRIGEVGSWLGFKDAESFEATTSPAGTKGSGMSRLKANAIINKVKAHMGPHLDFIEVCGSYRRGNQTPKDLDFVVIPKAGVTLPNILPPNQGVNWVGDKKAQVVIDNETVDFRVSSPTGLGAALMYFTGPAGYNIGMRMRAKKMGLKLNEYGVFDRNTGAYIAGATEADVYQALGKNYKAPDQRGK